MTTMPGWIAIECTCGRRGSISSRLAGRKVRCTGCGEPVRVPTASGSAPAARGSSEVSSAVVTIPSAAPAKGGDSLDLMPEVTRPFHEPMVTRQRRAPADADEAPRKRRGSSGHRRDVDWERHLRGIAIWPMISGVLGVALVFIGTFLLLLAKDTPIGFVAVFAIGVFAASALQFAYGYFLWAYGETARVLHLVFSGVATALGLLSVIGVPGTTMKVLTMMELAWPAAMFAVLLSPRAATICSGPYRTLVARTPRVSVAWWTSPFFYLPIVLTALAALAILAAIASFGGL